MQTCHNSRSLIQAASGSPPQGCPPDAADRAPTATKHGQWSVQEKSELINFLSNHKTEVGDGANFKQTIWTQAATHMSMLHPNVIFSANQC